MSSDTPKTISIKIAIDIPVDIAADTLSKIQPVISQLSNSSPTIPIPEQPKPLISDQTEEEKEEARQYYENNIKIFRKKSIQAYRLYRRLAPEYEKSSQIYSAIAHRLEWPYSVVPGQISERKRKLKAYIKQRNLKTVLRLAYEGWSNKAIAKRFGFSTRQVARYLKEARSQTMGAVK